MNVVQDARGTGGGRRVGPGRVVTALAGAVLVALAPSVATPAASAPAVSAPAASATAASATAGPGPELRALVERGSSTAALGELRENGRRIWRDAAGVTDLESRRPARADGRFRIGSVTKTFVSTVVLQLVDEGRLRLDDPVERHLPGVVPDGGAITVRQLLNHTSGLHDYLDDPRYFFHDDASLRTFLAEGRWAEHSPAELIGVGTRGTPYFPPGRGWHYSNTNYILLGEVIRHVTGRSWQSEVERRIVRPLHLDDTTFPGSRPGIPGPHAHGYARLPEGPADLTLINPTVGDAAGNGISTAADLGRFHAALFGGKLLRPARLAEMTTAVPAPMIGAHYGLGLIRYDLPCGAVWGHTGGVPGYSTVLLGSVDGTRQFALSFNVLEGTETDATDAAVNAFVERAACGPRPAAPTVAVGNSPLRTPR
ncbi:serine hydrolase domain-containing protein [Kitasatospora purpeofusca]|uniref:serine hydrolase domain-containing protein n=1 Tax=Kitasatospora purpeofusca TaxID=67352 RepID=UPI0035D88AB5